MDKLINGVGRFLLAVSILWNGLVFAQERAQDKPNIIFILADDLGYGDVGFNGQELIQTPHIDLLAKEGRAYDTFYAGSTVCAPSRSSLMSGQHTGHTFIRGNKGVEPEGQFPIADSVVTLAEVLQDRGYKTGAFGKWGLGPVGSSGDPNRQGFDKFYGYNCQSLAHRYYPGHLWDNGQKVLLTENKNLQEQKQYAPDLIHEQTLNFIRQNQDDPFFLFLPYILPHGELIVPDDSLFNYYKGKFEETPFVGKDYGENAAPGGYASQRYPRAAFAAMVGRLDRYVGDVLETLETLGLDSNTIIIFTSDNGPHVEGGADPDYFNSSGGLRGVKRDLYEGGIRVPFVVRWPAQIAASSKGAFVGAFWDILPTLADITGASIPHNLDGVSFKNSLRGHEAEQKQHDYLYWEFHEQGGKQAVRWKNWKGIKLNAKSSDEGLFELYDLSGDVSEKYNIADKYPDIARKILEFMEEAHQESAIFPFE